MQQGLFELHVRPNGRHIADEYQHNGHVWIEGREGSRYELLFKNNSQQRALAIISVDGLDILTGKPAGSGSPGYVVNPYSELVVPGWKINNQEAAEFYFSRKSSSYVAKIGGSVSNTGVIGAMVFSESPLIMQFPPSRPASKSWNDIQAIPMPMTHCINSCGITYNSVIGSTTNQQNSVIPDLGTGFGDAISFTTYNTPFNKVSLIANETIVVYYNTAENLKKMGIQLRTRNSDTRMPLAFPRNAQQNCKPPPSWVK